MTPSYLDTGRRPLVLVWELTQACDLACDHCRADAEPMRHPNELTTEEGKQLLKDASGFGDDQLVVLSGGDPLKRPDLHEIIRYGNELGLRMTLTPSGTSSLDKDAIKQFSIDGLRRLALSIDGAISATHDEFRGESGSYRHTIEAARHAREAGIPLQINTTVCRQTVQELPGIKSLVEQLDAVLWSLFFLVPIGRGASIEPVTPEEAESVMKWLCRIEEEMSFGVKTTEAPHYRRVKLQEKAGSGDEPLTGGITAGDGFAFVSHTGELYPSGFLPLSAGNVREESVVDLYRSSELLQRLRDRNSLKGECGDCRYRGVCGGSRSRAYAITGDPLESDPLCSYVPQQD